MKKIYFIIFSLIVAGAQPTLAQLINALKDVYDAKLLNLGSISINIEKIIEIIIIDQNIN